MPSPYLLSLFLLPLLSPLTAVSAQKWNSTANPNSSTSISSLLAFQKAIEAALSFAQVPPSQWNRFYYTPMTSTDLSHPDEAKRNAAVREMAAGIPFDLNDPIDPTRTGDFATSWHKFVVQVKWPTNTKNELKQQIQEAATQSAEIKKQLNLARDAATKEYLEEYVPNMKKMGGKNAEYRDFSTWAQENAVVYLSYQSMATAADMKLKHLIALNLGPGSEIWARAYMDINNAVTSVTESVPGVNMMVDSNNMDVFIAAINEPSQSHRRRFRKRGITGVKRYAPLWEIPSLPSQLLSWRASPQNEFQWQTSDTANRESKSIKSSGEKDRTSRYFFIKRTSAITANDQQVEDADDAQLAVSVAFRGVGLFRIQPGQWWLPNWGYPSMIDPVMNPEMAENEELFATYFAPGRELNRIHSHVLLGYKPRVTVTLSQNLTDFLRKRYQEGQKVCVFFLCSQKQDQNDGVKSTMEFHGAQISMARYGESPVVLAKGYDTYT